MIGDDLRQYFFQYLLSVSVHMSLISAARCQVGLPRHPVNFSQPRAKFKQLPPSFKEDPQSRLTDASVADPKLKSHKLSFKLTAAFIVDCLDRLVKRHGHPLSHGLPVRVTHKCRSFVVQWIATSSCITLHLSLTSHLSPHSNHLFISPPMYLYFQSSSSIPMLQLSC